MPEYSSTKLTPNSTIKFPANNGNAPGYVEGADLTTKTEFNEAISSLSSSIIQGVFSLTVTTTSYSSVYLDQADRDVPITNKTIKGINVRLSSDHVAWIGRTVTVGGKLIRLFVFSAMPLTNKTLNFEYTAVVE